MNEDFNINEQQNNDITNNNPADYNDAASDTENTEAVSEESKNTAEGLQENEHIAQESDVSGNIPQEPINSEKTSERSEADGNADSNIHDINEAKAISNVKQRKRKKSNFKKYVALVLAASLISGSAVGGGLYYKFSNELNKQALAIQKLSTASTAQSSSTSSNLVKTTYTNSSTVTDIAKKVGPSIVGIRVTESNQGFSFYGSDSSEEEGSGIIISKDGYIMTNYHVVEYADPKNNTSGNTTLEVFLSDKTQAKAKFIGGDSETDLAVIKVDLKNLPVAELGDSSKLQVGELAIAIGNPLGLQFAGSVTVGVISATNRSIESDTSSQDLIQTDAAINPGNSGGALLNAEGQVVGINSSKISETGVEGLGFAIPINDAKPIINDLMAYGYVKGRPFIGISGQEVTQAISQAYNLPVGIYISAVSSGSGAEKAGMKVGDVLTSLAGKAVTTMDEVNTIKLKYKSGDTVKATVVRNGKTITLNLTFSEER